MDSRRISDELEIAALLTRYARAVDSRDWDLYRSVFTDDAHIDYSAEVAQELSTTWSSSFAMPGPRW